MLITMQCTLYTTIKKITQERDHTKKLLYAKSRCPKPRDNVEQYEEQDDETEDEVAHQFAIVLAGSHHEVDAFHAARQKTGRAVKVTVLPKHTEICVHTAVHHGRVQSCHEQLTGMIELHVVLLYSRLCYLSLQPPGLWQAKYHRF